MNDEMRMHDVLAGRLSALAELVQQLVRLAWSEGVLVE